MHSETCLIKSGNYKGGVTKDGVEYVELYRPWQRPLQWVVKRIQKILWYCGVAVYDPIFGECTPDFNCCTNIGRKKIFSWHPKGKG